LRLACIRNCGTAGGLIIWRRPVILTDGTAMIGIPTKRARQGHSETLNNLNKRTSVLDEDKTTQDRSLVETSAQWKGYA
jgi:hypothetical protein